MALPLTFSQFVASRRRTETLCADLELDDDAASQGGFVYAGGCYIEDNTSADPVINAKGSQYLLIERQDWISSDLPWLEKILWAYHYCFEGSGDAPPNLSGDDLRAFLHGYITARALTVDFSALGEAFFGAAGLTPHEAAALINKAAVAAPVPDAEPAKLEIRKLLVLSTSHVTKATADLLNSTDAVTSWPWCGGPYGEYGWMFYCAEENNGEGDRHIPDDLFAVMQFARANGCDNVLLDRDSEPVDGLPTWEWW